MKKSLLDLLVCPTCLPREIPLKGVVYESDDGDILSGHLLCKSCGSKYDIDDGIAVLLPQSALKASPSQNRYEEKHVISSYLWSHYADVFGVPDANDAYSIWASHLSYNAGIAIDAGCSVGRFTFELNKKSDFTIGLDRSFSFIRLARKLLKTRNLKFPMITEGHLSEQRSITIPNGWDSTKVEFIVGDALALPFYRGSFTLISSLNLLDKVPKPLRHLTEINRIAKKRGAVFLFSDPFSWSAESAEEKDWLGGKTEGEYTGRGIENVSLLIKGKYGVMHPPWTIVKEGFVSWKIRNHCNHYEMIRSEFIVSKR